MEMDKIALVLAILAFLFAVGIYISINDYKATSEIRLNTLEMNSAPISSLNPRLTNMDNQISENKRLADDTINHCYVFENTVTAGYSISCRQLCKSHTNYGAKGVCLFAQTAIGSDNPQSNQGNIYNCDAGSVIPGSKSYCVCC